MTPQAGSVSSIPSEPLGHAEDPRIPRRRGGETEPNEPTLAVLAVMRAHRAWAVRNSPWTLEEWLNA
jgi:hypothetical protein